MQARRSAHYGISLALDAITSKSGFAAAYRAFVRVIDTILPAPQNRLTSLRATADLVWLVTMIVAFGVNALFAARANRFWFDNSDATRNFAEDLGNVLNYSIICPGYVTFGTLFVLTIGRIVAQSQQLFITRERPLGGNRSLGVVVTVGLIVALSATSVANYAVEALNYRKLYWFAERAPSGAEYPLHGYYYILINFLLNIVVMLAGVYAFKLWTVAYSVEETARSIRSGAQSATNLSENVVKQDLRLFSIAYVYFKCFLFFLYANVFTWYLNEPSGSNLLLVSGIALLVGILGLVSVPKYHIQYWIHQVFLARGEDTYVDIRSQRQQMLCDAIDAFILGTALINALSLYLPELTYILEAVRSGA